MKKIILGLSLISVFALSSCKETYECLGCSGDAPKVKAKDQEDAIEKCKEKGCASAIEILDK